MFPEAPRGSRRRITFNELLVSKLSESSAASLSSLKLYTFKKSSVRAPVPGSIDILNEDLPRSVLPRVGLGRMKNSGCEIVGESCLDADAAEMAAMWCAEKDRPTEPKWLKSLLSNGLLEILVCVVMALKLATTA